jgi:L-alanine-DL-glutamate epimerase-like enolase superfamily enzyme
VGLAADLQLASALPHTDFVEFLIGSAFVQDLTIDNWQLNEDGKLPIPDGPGLGITIDENALSEYSGKSLAAS